METLQRKKEKTSWLMNGMMIPKKTSPKKTLGRSPQKRYETVDKNVKAIRRILPGIDEQPPYDPSKEEIIQAYEKENIEDNVKIAQGKDLFQQMTLESVHYIEEEQQLTLNYNILQERYKKLIENYRNKSLQIYQMQDTLESLKKIDQPDKNREIFTQAENAKKHEQELLNNIHSLQNDNLSLEAQYQSLHDIPLKYSSLQDKLSQVYVEIENAKNANNSKIDKISQMEKDKIRIRNDIDILKAKISKKRKQAEMLSHSLQQVQELCQKKEHLKNTINQIKTKCEREDPIIEELSSHYQKLILKSDMVCEKNKLIHQKMTKIKQLRHQLRNFKQVLSEQRYEIDQKTKETSPKQFSIMLTRKIEDKKEKSKRLAQENEQAIQDINSLKEYIDDLQDTLEESNKIKKHLILQQNDLRNEVKETIKGLPTILDPEEDSYDEILKKSKSIRQKITQILEDNQ